ncbi:MAG: alpha/beta hydrolase [Desulfobacterales bacterium]|nr:alpha/beta hydrolase [Desulfobacterales bacterium]
MPYKEINGINLNYEIKGNGEPLLFIHGLGSSLMDWELQVEYFSKQYKVIVVDLRGHGKSSKPSGRYSIGLFAADVAELLRELNLYPAHINGLSMGGATGLHIAVHHSDVVKSLIVSNMSAAMPVKTFAQKKMYYTRVLITMIFGTGKMGEIISKNVFPKTDQEELRNTLIRRWSKNGRRPYLNSLRALKNWDIIPELHRIKSPVLIVHAENDYTPLAIKKDYASKIKSSDVQVIDDARHIVNMEKPDIYNKMIASFIGNLY